jgi:hypothetical protein
LPLRACPRAHDVPTDTLPGNRHCIGTSANGQLTVAFYAALITFQAARKARRKKLIKAMGKTIRGHNLKATVVMALLMVLVLALVVAVESATTTFSGTKGKEPQGVVSSETHASKAFEEDRDIWLASKNHLANLTPNTASNDEDPSISPDGRKVAFASDRDGDFEIYTANVFSGKLQQLTDNVGDDRYPAWSPDGTKISFWYKATNTPESYMTNIDVSGR